jgi:hypothetical protein
MQQLGTVRCNYIALVLDFLKTPFGLGLKTIYFSRDWGLLPVSEMILYKSETLKEGARYSIINSYKLGQ